MLGRRLVSKVARTIKPFSRASSSSTPAPPAYTANTPAAASSVPAPQSPNYPSTWSTNQRARPQGQSGPRFEQTAMELQPNPLSAMELIGQEPVRLVHGRKAVCDGGGGALGHPKIYINLDQAGPRPCGYCGIRFEQAPHHH